MAGTQTVPGMFMANVPASTRRFYFTKLISRPFNVLTIRASFAPNQQRTLLVRAWVTPVGSLGDNAQPVGVSVFGELGTVDYIAGDGDTKEIAVHRQFQPGYLCIDANNTDADADGKDLDVVAHLEEIIY